MYGLIGRMSAVAGRRDELLAILLKSVGGHARMPQLRCGDRSRRA